MKNSPKVALTSAERNIMTILWSSSEPMTSAEIRERGNKAFGIDSYTFSLINSLLKKGMIKEVGKKQTYKKNARLFAPVFSRDDYHVAYFEEYCNNDIDNLLSGLVTKSDQKQEIVDQIKLWINAYEQEEE